MPSPTKVSKQRAIATTLALPAAGTVASQWMPVRGRRLSIPVSWTGTPTGVFSLQLMGPDGVTPLTVPGASAEFTANGNAQPAGGASSATWNWSNVPGSQVRILYTATSSTGTATLWPTWAE